MGKNLAKSDVEKNINCCNEFYFIKRIDEKSNPILLVFNKKKNTLKRYIDKK